MSAEPFLFRFATARTPDSSELPGHYCDKQQVWVVETKAGEQPLVEIAPGALTETQTKTMADIESDDDDQGRGALMETSTYTKVQQESDDQDASIDLPELQTKTDVQQERDDQIDGLI